MQAARAVQTCVPAPLLVPGAHNLPSPFPILLSSLSPDAPTWQVVEELFPAVLRCQPGGDFLQENAELFRLVGGCCRERESVGGWWVGGTGE